MFYIISLLLLAADQIIKYIIDRQIPFRNGIEIIPGFFDLVNWRNTGAAWGIFSDATIYLSIISTVASILIIYLLPKVDPVFLRTAFSLILAGAAGNLIDRIRLGYVIDYLSFDIFGYDFPVFNLADICVVTGCIMTMVFVLFIHKEEKPIFIKPVFPKIKRRENKQEGGTNEGDNNVQ